MIRFLIPSMFHRRLLLIAAGAGLAALPLVAQLSRLTVVRSAELRDEAESKLVRRQWTPTVRGSIVDRKGRVLAHDRPSYDVLVPYAVINGEWASEQAKIVARRTYGRTGWMELKPAQRDEVEARLLPVFQLHLENGWNRLAATLGITRAELDGRRDAVVDQLSRQQEIIGKRRLDKELADAAARKEELTPERLAAMHKRASAPIAEFKQSHVIAGRVSDDLGFVSGNMGVEEVSLEPVEVEPGVWSAAVSAPLLPGLTVVDTGDRDYPYEAMEVAVSRRTLPGPLRADDEVTVPLDGVACHIVGRLRDKIFGDQAADAAAGKPGAKGDATRRREYLAANPAVAKEAVTDEGIDRGAYRDGDRVGDTGLEGANEMTLRGLRGSALTRLDTGQKDYVPAVKGQDLALTLDIMLQARVQAAMSKDVGLAVVQPWHMQESATQPVGTALHGAAVVLDVDTGEILAAVSTPTFSRRQVRDDPDSVYRDRIATPYVNRCWEQPYPPGSIIKAPVLAGAVTFGNYQPDERIACTGYLIPNQPTIYRCLIYKRYGTTHTALLSHDLDGSEAVMVSCNIFFYTMGRRMGPDSIVRLYRAFGVAQPFDLGAGPEFPGQLGRRNDGTDLNIPDAIQMAIGQGPVSWTPLHAADAYATLARAGTRVAPSIIKGRGGAAQDLGLDPRGVQMAMEGLRLAVNGEHATGRTLTFGGNQELIFNAEGVKVWGKTGTATAPSIREADPDGPGPAKGDVIEEGDHSWFVVIAGRDRPRYVIAVVIDYGGSGGKVSGPIANQIIHALIAEGYL
jgi:penicillin-binding protein 2